MSSLLQVWAPLLATSRFNDAFARDLHRVEQVWEGSLNRMWLMPNATKKVFWNRPLNGFFYGEGMIPAECSNVISIFHIDENRQMYPPMLLPKEWGGKLPQGLYRKWLNIEPYPIPLQVLETIPMFIPREKGGKIMYKPARLNLGQGSVLSSSVEERNGKRTMVLSWPQDRETVAPISPETESVRRSGRVKQQSMVVNSNEVNGIRSEQFPDAQDSYFWLMWPEPFNLFFPYAGWEDVVFHRGIFMRNCIATWQDGKRDQALRDAEIWANHFSHEVRVPTDWAWLMPKLVSDPKDTIFEVKSKYDIDVDSVAELFASKNYVKLRESRVPVRRIHGWLGLFWWELYQDMLADDFIGSCKSCRDIIRGGHKDREYCTQEENQVCSRKRARIRQRRWRNKLKGQ